MTDMQLCMNEMTFGGRSSLIADIEACAQHSFTCMEIRKASLMDYLRQGEIGRAHV